MEKRPDKVMLVCPECKSFIPVSTYKGDCRDKTYPLDEAPLILVAEVHEESKAGRIQCMSCGMHIALEDQYVSRTIHRFQSIILFINFSEIHTFIVMIPMT